MDFLLWLTGGGGGRGVRGGVGDPFLQDRIWKISFYHYDIEPVLFVYLFLPNIHVHVIHRSICNLIKTLTIMHACCYASAVFVVSKPAMPISKFSHMYSLHM